MAQRRRQHLDETDHELCRLLVAEPRVSLRELAARTGVTNETVAARLRRLRESNVLAMTVAVDWVAAGYKAGALVRIKAPLPAATLLRERLVACPDVHFVGTATGVCDLVIAVLGVDLAGVRAVLRSALRGIGNITVSAVDVVTEVLAYDVSNLTLPLRAWSPETLPDPDPPLDDLDHALVRQLATAGHESNREIARRLKVSDATVRSRIRRLEGGGLMRLVVGVDPVAAGARRLFAMVFVSFDDQSLVAPLVKHDAVLAAFATVGQSDLVLHVAGRSVHEVGDFVMRELATVDGVRGIEVAHLADVAAHQSHFARFV